MLLKEAFCTIKLYISNSCDSEKNCHSTRNPRFFVEDLYDSSQHQLIFKCKIEFSYCIWITYEISALHWLIFIVLFAFSVDLQKTSSLIKLSRLINAPTRIKAIHSAVLHLHKYLVIIINFQRQSMAWMTRFQIWKYGCK